ncbi:MAG: beta-galactosidase/beta-glucuronidase [Gemmatimonadetes bacterium]|nr:beta-galactosidase/beta-glucuronidase [Gemmatimonadota bacterium]
MTSTARASLAVALTAACTACGAPPAPAPVEPTPSSAPVSAAPAVPPPPAWHAAAGPLMTRWAAQVTPENVLPEYPRPQMVRPRWQSLNGLWQLAFVTDSAAPQPFGQTLPQQVLVPFPIESALSGVMKHADRIVYRRTFRANAAAGERQLLHFGAVDWHARVFVNGRQVADHTGGYDAFTVDVTDALRGDGDQELVVAVFDPTDTFGQPRGKQVSNPEGIFYTPVTGIWQTVWLEPVPAASIDALRMTPDVAGKAVRLTVRGRGARPGQTVEAVATAGGREVGRATGAVGAEIRIPVPNPRLWGPDDPFLYDLRVTLRSADGAEVDHVDSYFGMRTVAIGRDARGFNRITLNGRPVFLLGPLDQGWWPDGLYTAPTDGALRSDIEMTKRLGYGMTRKHIKVEPARWYYWADRLGLPVWQDMPSGWNDTPAARGYFEADLRAMMDDLHSSPSIIAWVPFNEKWGQWSDEGTRRTVALVKELDPSRIVNDASGWQHAGVGDLVDVHRYQGPQALVPSATLATVDGEFGGLGYPVPGHLWRQSDANWGYGGAYKSQAEMNDRYDLLIRRMWRLRDTHGMSAGVYTQMTDVETEVNGLLTYDRAVTKFDVERTAAVNRGLAPLILPEYGEFTDSVRVTVHQGTPTELRYTVDGSAPTASSPLFRPVTLRRDAVVRVRGFLGGRPTAAPEARMEYRRVAGLAADAGARVVPGVDYAFYADTTTEPVFRLSWPVRWRLERLNAEPRDVTPTKTGTLPNFSLAPRDRDEMFGFRFTGWIRVPRDGVYTFGARSDDGVALWIGGRNVFWSMGQSPATTEDEGMIALKAGLHPYVLSYHNAYGPMVMEVFVQGPGMGRRRVPSSMLFRAAAGGG